MTPARQRIVLFVTSLILVPLLTWFVILFARGYRPNTQTGNLEPTGILAAHSYPDGAQVFIDNRFVGATNATINLSPGDYQVEIRFDGYQTWQKQLHIEKEIVTKATAVLFPSVPTFKPVTQQAIAYPLLSPDGDRVIYSQKTTVGWELYSLDLADSPLGILNRDPKLVTTLPTPATPSAVIWSPASDQIIVKETKEYRLINLDSGQTATQTSLPKVLADWKTEVATKQQLKLAQIPLVLDQLLATTSAHLVFSPRENKILYTATASAQLPDQIKKPLPGSNTQPQSRTLTPGSVYVFDLEEDRNFLVGKNANKNEINAGFSWFPTSSHLYWLTGNQVWVKEYDNQNVTLIYEGPLENGFAFPYPSAKQLLILAAIPSSTSTSSASLYAVNLR